MVDHVGEAGVDGQEVQPPQTKLTEMLVVFQNLFQNNPTFQLLEPCEVVARILEEPENHMEISRFIESYLWPPDLENTKQGMAVMFILGYMFARGETHTKGRIL